MSPWGTSRPVQVVVLERHVLSRGQERRVLVVRADVLGGDARLEPARRMAAAGAILGLAMAAGFGVLRFANADPPILRTPWDLALAVPYATPALLALLGVRRPALLLAGGALGILLAAWGAISFVSLVLVPPSVLYLVAATRARVSRPGAVRTAASVLLSLVIGWSALFALVLRDDPACWARVPRDGGSRYVRLPAEPFVHSSSISMSSEELPPGSTESGCSSDQIAPVEALVSVALVGITLAGAWTLAAPAEATVRAPA